MEIKKTPLGCEITFNETKIYLDPQKPQENYLNILSNISPKINCGTNFSLPGEYEVENIFIKGYQVKDRIVYILTTRETTILFINGNVDEEVLKNIKNEFKEIDIGIYKNLDNYEKIKNVLKSKVDIFLEKSPKIKVEKVKGVKLNLKKLEEKAFLLI